MPPDLEAVLEHLSTQPESLEGEGRTGSRFAGQEADRSFTEHVAHGGTSTIYSQTGARVVKPSTTAQGFAVGSGPELLRAVKAARRGDPDAHRRLSAKGWVEGRTPPAASSSRPSSSRATWRRAVRLRRFASAAPTTC